MHGAGCFENTHNPFLLKVEVKKVPFRMTLHVLRNSPEWKRKTPPRCDARAPLRCQNNEKIPKHAMNSSPMCRTWVIVVQRSHQLQDCKTIVDLLHNYN